MKKTLVLLLVAAMAIGLLAGCGGGEATPTEAPKTDAPATEAPATEAPVDTEAPATEEPTEEPVQEIVKFTMSQFRGPRIDGTQTEKNVEEALGCDIDFIWIPDGDDGTTKTSLIMSDDTQMPDVLKWSGMTKEAAEWYHAGLLIDLSDLLAKYGDNLIDYYPMETWYMNYFDGAIYRVPGDVSEPSCFTLWMRQDWLDKLGLELPKTYAEWENCIKLMAEGDMNDSGDPKNTFGFSAQSGEYRTLGPFTIPYAAHFEHYVVVNPETSEIIFGALEDGAKEALKNIHKAYENGWMDQAYLTSNDLGQQFNDGVWGSAYRWAAWHAEASQATFHTNCPDGVLVPIDVPPLEEGGYTSDEPDNYGGWCYWGITKQCEDPEAVFKIMDQLASGPIYVLQNWGPQGETWDWKDGDAQKRVLVRLGKYADSAERTNYGLGLFYGVANRKDEYNYGNDQDTYALFAHRIETSAPARAKRIYFKATDMTEYNTRFADLQTTRDSFFSDFISGAKDIDAEWDNYVKTFKEGGGVDRKSVV